MLFDLQGKRRRVVQVTYVTLALLMGGGLVLFGVGSDVSGGLANVFDGGGGGGGNSQVQKRIDRLEKQVKANPQSASARGDLTRSYFQLASSEADSNGAFGDDAKADLRRSAANWQAYLKIAGQEKADPGLAATALQVYSPGALSDSGNAKETAQLIASKRNTTNAYLQLVQYALLDNDTRTTDLAGQKAVDLAQPGQRKTVRANIKQIKQQAQAAQAQQAQGANPQQ